MGPTSGTGGGKRVGQDHPILFVPRPHIFPSAPIFPFIGNLRWFKLMAWKGFSYTNHTIHGFYSAFCGGGGCACEAGPMRSAVSIDCALLRNYRPCFFFQFKVVLSKF